MGSTGRRLPSAGAGPLLASALVCLASACAGGGGGGGGSTAAAQGTATSSPGGPPPAQLVSLARPDPTSPDDWDQNGIPDRLEWALAAKWAPCLVFTGERIWPVEVRYLWARGGELRCRDAIELNQLGDIVVLADIPVLPAADLDVVDWSQQPDRNEPVTVNGVTIGTRRYEFYVDGPGDATGPGPDDMTWADEFEAIQGGPAALADPLSARYPPTLYVHYYWHDRAAGVLEITYWGYLPFDKWANAHEGDWTEVRVFLQLSGQGDARFDPAQPNQTPLRYNMVFHGWSVEELARLTRVGDLPHGPGHGDHVVAFVGGEGAIAQPQRVWSGSYSGGSYPWPGRYALFDIGYGPVIAFDDVRTHRRFIHANDMRLIVLPDTHTVDFAAHPELSFMNLRFYVGQRETGANSLIVKGLGNHRSPGHMARKGPWRGAPPGKMWTGSLESASHFVPFQPPAGWPVIANPGP